MKKAVCITLLLALMFSALQSRTRPDTLGVGTAVYFTENMGQWDMAVRYAAQLHGGALFLETDGITVALREVLPHPSPLVGQLQKPKSTAYRMRFAGCQPAVLTPSGKRPGYSNYYLSASTEHWRSRVHSYTAVTYGNLYEGIDLEVYSSNRMLKYNWIVNPEADPRQIAIDYEGVQHVKVDKRGNLHISTVLNEVIEMRPYAYQRGTDKEQEIASRYEVERILPTDRQAGERYRVRIALGDYDPQKPLIIDPVLIFSTYTGSTADNWGTTAAYDAYRNVYTAGLVFAQGYPTSVGALDTSFNGACDIGIFKFDSTGTERLWATYLGGEVCDMPHSMYVNHFNELLIFGTTGSNDFPVTPDAVQPTFAGGSYIDYESSSSPYPDGSDLFVSRLTEDGQLAASTYLGGSGNDGLNYRNYFNNSYTTIMSGNDSLYYNYGDGARGEIITDNLGNVYIGSTTMSSDFPVSTGCVQAQNEGRQEGVVIKLDYNLRNIIWSTYLGGMGDDAVYSIDVDSTYNLLVCGGTNSADFPVTDQVVQPAYAGGSADGFVAKIAYDGQRLMSSTYYGSDAYDQIYFVRVGHRDEVFLFGQTAAEGSLMIYNAGYSTPGSGMLLARLSPQLDTLRWSTVFGTPNRINLSPTAFAADICNRVYAAGWGRDFVGYNGVGWYAQGSYGMETTTDAWSDSTDGQDFYIMSIAADASELEYATFFGELHNPSNGTRGGGDHVDGGTSRFDRMATLYQSVCASCGGFNNFPTTADAWSDSNLSTNCNNALFRFNVTSDFPVADFTPPSAGCAPYTVNFNNTGRGTSFLWNFGDGTTSTGHSPSHTYTQGGIYTITLIANMPGGCSEADTVRRQVQVLSSTGQYRQPHTSCNNTLVQIGHTPALGATYHWLTSGVSDSTVANPWVDSAGIYLLNISALGCEQTDTFEVVGYQLVDTFWVTPPQCHDSANAQLSIALGAGLDADSITFQLTLDGTPHPMHWQDAQHLVADSLQAGGWAVFRLEGYGCEAEQAIRIPNPPRPDYRKQTSGWLCSDSCSGWVRIAPVNEAGMVLADTLFDGLCAGRHVTTIEGVLNCPVVDTTIIRIDHSLDTLRAWANRTIIYSDDTTRLHTNLPTGATCQWSPSFTLDNEHAASPIASPIDSLTLYTVRATSNTGCTASDSVLITVKRALCPEPELIVPNAFTPNGDGRNDRLVFTPTHVVRFRIAIFNRWGEKVFETHDLGDSWDGTYHSQPCMQGVYTYIGSYTCINGEEFDFKGDVTLIR